jgi:spermidine synthase
MTSKNDILIREQDDLLELVFKNSPDAVQSAILKSSPEQLVMQNLQYLMGILLFIDAPKKILLLGVGAGSLVHFLRFHFADSHITGIDLDETLLQTAQRDMLLPVAGEKLTYVIDDARKYIENCSAQFDLIVVDIFDGSQTPAWVFSLDFTRKLQGCLSPRGALAYNLLINSERGFEQFYSQLRRVFRQQTLCLECEQYANILLYGLNFSTPPKSMGKLLQMAQRAEQKFDLPFHQILSVIFNINPQDSGII